MEPLPDSANLQQICRIKVHHAVAGAVNEASANTINKAQAIFQAGALFLLLLPNRRHLPGPAYVQLWPSRREIVLR